MQRLRKLGYEVSEAFKRDDLTVYRVVGPGIDMMVDEKDDETINHLANKDAHAHRVLYEEGKASDAQLFESDLKAKISLGHITKQEASELRVQ